MKIKTVLKCAPIGWPLVAMSETCYICFESNNKHRLIVSPCQCKGANSVVHLDCLNRFLDHRVCGDAKSAKLCSICGSEYKSCVVFRRGEYLRLFSCVCVTFTVGSFSTLLVSAIIFIAHSYHLGHASVIGMVVTSSCFIVVSGIITHFLSYIFYRTCFLTPEKYSSYIKRNHVERTDDCIQML